MEGSKFHDYRWRKRFQPDFESRQTLLRQAVRDRTVWERGNGPMGWERQESIGSRDEEESCGDKHKEKCKDRCAFDEFKAYRGHNLQCETYRQRFIPFQV